MADTLLRTDYQFLKEFLDSRIGHDLGDGKEYLALSRLGVVAEAQGLPNLATLFDRLRRARDPALEAAVAEAMVTGETSFFRTPSIFERLRLDVVPQLIQARADQRRRLTVWSAGCSTGQEPYSIAITLAEHFPELRDWSVSILATDLSDRALQQAKLGSYTETEAHRGLSDALLRKYLQPRLGRWVIDHEIRRLVSFEKQNLVEPLAYQDDFDIIFVRNVLIYFCTARKRSVFAGLRRAIRDDGYLFLGETETILGLTAEFLFPPNDIDYYRPEIEGARSVLNS